MRINEPLRVLKSSLRVYYSYDLHHTEMKLCLLMWNVTIRNSRKHTIVGIYQSYEFSQNKICKSEQNKMRGLFFDVPIQEAHFTKGSCHHDEFH